MDKRTVKRTIGVCTAAAFVALFAVVPPPEGLAIEGWKVLGVLCGAIALWLANTFPRYIVTMYIIASVVALGCYGAMNDALRQFMSNATFMIVGSFLLASMLSNTNLPLRVVGRFVKVTKDDGRFLLLAILLTTTMLSSLCDDITALTIMYAFVVPLFNIERGIVTPQDRNLKAALMIGLPVAAYAGGMITPVGAPTNVVAIEMLRTATGVEMTFAQWFAIMLPIAFLIMLVYWFFLCVAVKPGKLSEETYEKLKNATSLGKWTAQEKKSAVILASMLTMWFSSTFFPILTNAMVICIGGVAMFFPGVEVITHDDFQKHASWDLFFFMPGIMIIANVIQTSGLVDWAVADILPMLSSLPPYATILLVSVLILAIRSTIQAGPPVTILMIPAVMEIGSAVGIDPAAMMIVCVIWGTICYLMPIDILKSITYDLGQFSVRQLLLTELPTIVVTLVFLTFYVPFIVGVVM